MEKLHTSRWATFGCVLILIGTSIGAGLLAMPIMGSKLTYLTCILVLLIAWYVMSLTGLFILDVALKMPLGRNHFSSMAKATTGRVGQALAWVTSLCLFYTLIAAYISGNGSLIQMGVQLGFGWHISIIWCVLVFVVVVAGIIYFSTRGVDLFMRGLMSVKGLAMLGVIFGLLPLIHVNMLTHLPELGAADPHIVGGFKQLKVLLLVIPVFLVGFGYHAVIPSFINYIGRDAKRLRHIIWSGTTISLAIYILWITVSFGVIPLRGKHSLVILQGQGDHVQQFLLTLEYYAHVSWIRWLINLFSDIAMTTSCLGVALGLFDFLADGFGRQHTKVHRLQTLLLTLVPPFAVAYFFPHFFLFGLGLAGLFLVLLEVLLPVWMWYGEHKLPRPIGESYNVFLGKPLSIFVLICGVIFLIAAVVARLM